MCQFLFPKFRENSSVEDKPHVGYIQWMMIKLSLDRKYLHQITRDIAEQFRIFKSSVENHLLKKKMRKLFGQPNIINSTRKFRFVHFQPVFLLICNQTFFLMYILYLKRNIIYYDCKNSLKVSCEIEFKKNQV